MRFTGYDQDGNETRRDSKGWEWHVDKKTGVPRMAEDSAAIRREQAGDIQRETRHTVRGTRALDASTKMGNPARYANGGLVKPKVGGSATSPVCNHRKGR